MNYLNYKRWKG